METITRDNHSTNRILTMVRFTIVPSLMLVFLMLNRIWIPQAQRITAVALHLGVFQGTVIFLREALW